MSFKIEYADKALYFQSGSSANIKKIPNAFNYAIYNRE